ncbi:hypothetical protein EDD90_2803 [Streptomyces sp. Ag109_O5-1]|uniref:hypothetical protein n=1 Tax=Streptomyces sp. Ag109_O5-1 TaxID=1938851 RepID=UPI000F4EB36E|nr:hypothetical protein [Streptomyces sp. Ag109_O5-1]RPE39785.1 hypothetical protein EDD90_2803 [Streptomyces sp. Ag109_O5-1]
MTTTTPEPRCPYCLMPVEATTEGVAVVHDYPYAVATYGQCDGSNKPTLTGPGTPPAAWSSEVGKTYVELGVLPSPIPQVKRDGWTVTITGVRFTHMDHCPKCRRALLVATDGGVIQLGFDDKGRGFEKERPGARATYDGPCPSGCGARVFIGIGPFSRPLRGLPVSDARTLQWREWERLRRELGVHTVEMTPTDLARLRRKR